MRKLIIILTIYIFSCTPEKDIQVRGEQWELIDKKDAFRIFEEGFTWLIWQSQTGMKYWERMPTNHAAKYKIGMKIFNRI